MSDREKPQKQRKPLETTNQSPEEQSESEQLQTFPAGVILILAQVILIPICFWLATLLTETKLRPRLRFGLPVAVWIILTGGSLATLNIRADTKKVIEFIRYPRRFNTSRGQQFLCW